MIRNTTFQRPDAFPEGMHSTPSGFHYESSYSVLMVKDIPLEILTFYPKDKEPVAIVQMLHGMCEYKERYIPFMEALVSEGYICVIHDHRGHGASRKEENDLGYLYESTKKPLVSDAIRINHYIRKCYPKLPLFLFSHSMGTLVARNYMRLRDQDFSAVILSGPPCENKASGFGRFLAYSLALLKGGHTRSHLMDDLSVNVYSKAFPDEISCAWVCKDEETLSKYSKDPFCQFKFTLNGYCNLLDLLYYAFKKKGWAMKNRSLPIFVCAGEFDPCAGTEKDFKNTVLFLKSQGYDHVTWKRYKDMRHEILNETDRQTVYHDLIQFLNDARKTTLKKK